MIRILSILPVFVCEKFLKHNATTTTETPSSWVDMMIEGGRNSPYLSVDTEPNFHGVSNSADILDLDNTETTTAIPHDQLTISYDRERPTTLPRV